MGCGWRLDALCRFPEHDCESNGRRRPACCEDLSQRRPEHDRLVRSRGDPMKRMISARSIVISVVLATTGALVTAHAGVGAHVSRSKVAGIDLMTYPMGVEDVVSIVGSLPAGDYFAGRNAGN